MVTSRSIPRREDLLSQYRQTRRLATCWIVVQIVLSLLAGVLIDWGQVLQSPLVTTVVVAALLSGELFSVLRLAAAQKVEIGRLKETTRFGVYDRHQLRALVDDVLDRMRIPLPGPPVYVTADRTVNAAALRLGISGLLPRMNGIYLPRQVLHRLNAAELQDLIAHELGHYYRYPQVLHRFAEVGLVLGVLAGLVALQKFDLESYVSLLAIVGCGWAIRFVSGFLLSSPSVAIEYLCDELGAEMHGVVTSVNGLLKAGADSELQLALQQQELGNRRYGNLRAEEIVESISTAIPYGHSTREQIQQVVADSLKRRAQQNRGLSLGGFLTHAWSGEESSAVDELVADLGKLQQLPRLDWESLLERPGEIALDEFGVRALAELLEQRPDLVLFRLPEELDSVQLSHPSFRRRILYLWKNRESIEAACRVRAGVRLALGSSGERE